MTGSISSIETFGLVDGPGIRTVIFLNGCQLRCKFCHNPETWMMQLQNYTTDELVEKCVRNKPYFNDNGGVTLSGGEPLLQIDFITELCKKLKENGIHVALDTAGCGFGKYEEILSLVDLVLLDVKHTDSDKYLELTGQKIDRFNQFVDALNKSGKPVWIRQVIVTDFNDNSDYVKGLARYLKRINNIRKVEFLPYHKMGDEKYEKLGIVNPYKDKPAMDVDKCNKLYEEFLKEYN